MGLEPGQRVLDRYVIKDKLGEGGMGAVYRAVHDRLDLVVVIKVLTDSGDQDLSERFEREAKLMAQVRHPNVVSIHDYGFLEDGSPCMAMELIEGVPLDERLRTTGALSWEDASRFALNVLAGLEAMHAAQVLHRDMKPANLVIAHSATEYVKIIDFGIAKRTVADATQLTQAGGIVGTPAYMAPEQLYGYDLDERADLYAVGLILYQMLSGEDPGSGDSHTAVAKRISQALSVPRAPGHLPSVPAAVQDTCIALLQVEKEKRPRTAREAATRLQAATQAKAGAAAAPPADGATIVPGRGGAPIPGVTRPVAPRVAPPVTAGATIERPPPGAGAPSATGFLDGAGDDEAVGTHRYLIGAKIPRSRLVRREEQRWLAGLTQPGGKSFALGGQFWFAWQLQPTDAKAAEEEASSLAASVEERYGASARVLWNLVDQAFTITPAALSGSAPFPEEVRSLMDDLAG